MNRYKGILIVLLLSIAVLSWAETAGDFHCVYTEGEVLIGRAGTWSDLESGESADGECSINIIGNAMATFKTGSRQFTISSPGTYNLGDISRTIPDRQRVTVLDTFLDKLKKILNPEIETQTHALGVRAAEVEESGFEWTDADEEDFKYALELMDEGDLGEAEYMLEDLIMFGNPYQIDEYRFYLAYALLLQNRSGEALNQLNQIEEPSEFTFYEGYLILLGRLSYESMNDQKACEIWNQYLAEFPQGEAKEEAGRYLEYCD